MAYFTQYTLNIFCLWMLVWITGIYGNPFPFSDDWSLLQHVPVDISAGEVKWLFATHADHRIPLNKLYHIVTLRLSKFDFRIVQLTNILLIFAVSHLILRTLRSYNRGSNLGDFAIPIILLNPGLAALSWGFQFQFISSTLFFLGFALSLLNETCHKPSLNTLIASLCLFGMSFCGMNGVIPSLLVSTIMFATLCLTRPAIRLPLHAAILLILLATILSGIANVLAWHPSGAASVDVINWASHSVTIGSHFLTMINPNPIVIPEALKLFYPAFNGLLLVLALGILTSQLISAFNKRVPFELTLAGPYLALITTLLLLIFIAAGRYKYWTPGLEIHYGYLPIPLTVISWIVISHYGSRPLVGYIGFAFLCTSIYLYTENLGRRLVTGIEQEARVADIYYDAFRHVSISDLTAKHIRHFFYLDDATTRQIVHSGLRFLRDEGVEPYRHLTGE